MKHIVFLKMSLALFELLFITTIATTLGLFVNLTI